MNKQRLLRKSLRATEAFSLIEVVLALSIVAIGLVTIIGLFPQGLTSGRNAVDDSLCGIIAEDAIASRRIDLQNPVTSGATIGQANIPSRWYAANGTEILTPPSGANAMFQVVTTASVDPNIPNLEITQIQIMWPWLNPSLTVKTPSPPNTNNYYTEITKY
jgi:uncharacterized protein (TIGR02598 family)